MRVGGFVGAFGKAPTPQNFQKGTFHRRIVSQNEKRRLNAVVFYVSSFWVGISISPSDCSNALISCLMR